jgi:hypothetical protein
MSDDSAEQKTSSKEKFYFDRRIDVGHILTLVALIIAFFAFALQKEDLNTKVNDIQKIVDDLEREKAERKSSVKLSQLINSAEIIDGDNSALELSREIDKKISDHGMLTLNRIDDLAQIIIRDKTITAGEKKLLMLGQEISFAKQQIIFNKEKFFHLVEEFKKTNEPKKEKEFDDEYNKRYSVYVDSLKAYSERIRPLYIKKIDDFNEKISRLEDEYYKLEYK